MRRALTTMTSTRPEPLPQPQGAGRARARCRNGISPISIRRWTRRSSTRDLARAAGRVRGLRGALQGQARRAAAANGRAAHARRGGPALRGARRPARAGSASYAGLVYAGDTHRSDTRQVLRRRAGEADRRPRRHLLFFALELNRIDDAVLDAAIADARARPLPAVARGHAQGEALPARRQGRAAVPRKVGDRPRRLEPAVRRDHRGAALRRRRRGADARADAEPAAGPRRRPRRKAAPRRWRRRSSDNLRDSSR